MKAFLKICIIPALALVAACSTSAMVRNDKGDTVRQCYASQHYSDNPSSFAMTSCIADRKKQTIGPG